MSNLEAIAGFLERLADAVVIVNDSSEILYANPACSKLFGYALGELRGMSLEALVGSPRRSDHRELVRSYIRSSSAPKAMMARAQLPCVDAAGNIFNARISVSTVEIDNQLCGVATIQDFSSLQREIERLEIASHQDTLTGLFNRRYLERLTESDSRILQAWKDIGVVYLDLDRFKPINDRYGHEVGDAVLRVISNRIKSCLRFDDIVIRMGGDEFLVLLNLSDAPDAHAAIESIAEKIQDTLVAPIETEHASLTVGVSAGCGLYPESDSDLTRLVAKADKAMLLAKQAGAPIAFVEPRR